MGWGILSISIVWNGTMIELKSYVTNALISAQYQESFSQFWKEWILISRKMRYLIHWILVKEQPKVLLYKLLFLCCVRKQINIRRFCFKIFRYVFFVCTCFSLKNARQCKDSSLTCKDNSNAFYCNSKTISYTCSLESKKKFQKKVLLTIGNKKITFKIYNPGRKQFFSKNKVIFGENKRGKFNYYFSAVN